MWICDVCQRPNDFEHAECLREGCEGNVQVAEDLGVF